MEEQDDAVLSAVQQEASDDSWKEKVMGRSG